MWAAMAIKMGFRWKVGSGRKVKFWELHKILVLFFKSISTVETIVQRLMNNLENIFLGII